MTVVNHYEHCDTHWQDVWHFAGSNQCPVCGEDVDPHESEAQPDESEYLNELDE